MLVGIAGASSQVARCFIKNYCRDSDIICKRNPLDLPVGCDKFLICSGVLHGEKIKDISEDAANETFNVNFTSIARFCDIMFESNPHARICVIGSASGEQGSYDMTYAGAKSALQMYVKRKKVPLATQHLVCVSPWFIADAGMTSRRKDYGQVLERGTRRRLGRWVRSEEVARIANFALDEDALCNQVITAKGGNW